MLHLIATVAGRRMALDCAEIDTVVDIDRIVPTPLAELQVVGVTALRSRVVTVIDPAFALMLDDGEPTRSRRAAVTTIEGHSYAVLIDAVEDAVELERRPVPPGLALGGGWSRAARGTVELDGEALLVVALSAFVHGAGHMHEFAA